MTFRKSSEILREFVEDHQHFFDKTHEKTIYVIGLVSCLCAHISYFFIFHMLNIKEMMYFNIGSIAFYIVALIFVPILKNDKSMLLYLSDLEIIAHAAYATYLLGWKPDFGMFLLLIIPATFLTQGKRFYIPFIVTFISMAIYIYLKFIITDETVLKYPLEDAGMLRAMHMINVFIGAFVMLFASASYMLQREYMEYQLVSQRETFKNLASIDPLTQLYNRRAMNENIRTIRRECPTPSTSYVIGIGDIAAKRECLGPSLFCNGSCHFVDQVLSTRHTDDLRALTGQCIGHLNAEPGRRTGHDRYISFQIKYVTHFNTPILHRSNTRTLC